jgi:zinc/manganese transport system permease protein
MSPDFSEMLSVMRWPLIAVLVLPWLLVYLGLHIVQRGVIFVDLALAQTAAFGTAAGMLIGYDVHMWQSYVVSLIFTLAGALLLTFTRTSGNRVPQEALIGIVYIVAAAATLLALSHAHGGKEELQRSLVGELLVVPPEEIWKTLGLYLVIGGAHYAFRDKFSAISANASGAATAGVNIRLWDFIFYMLFGIVVTSFVHIGGVLLAFSYLVIPAVCSAFLADTLKNRFIIGWCVATIASVGTLYITSLVDLPIGAAIVCALGVILVAILLWTRLFRKHSGSH